MLCLIINLMSNLFGILPVCPSKRILLLCLSYVILLVSCTKNDIIYEKIVDTPSDQEVTDNDISRIKINFNANINQLTEFVSSSSTELAENRYASIFAYKRGGNLIQEETYYSKSQGTLTPTSESLFLTSGDTYSLYAAGVNDVNVAVPSFVDGKASDLAQNMDYIWWASYGYSPTSTNADVAVDFNHCCTQIVLRI